MSYVWWWQCDGSWKYVATERGWSSVAEVKGKEKRKGKPTKAKDRKKDEPITKTLARRPYEKK